MSKLIAPNGVTDEMVADAWSVYLRSNSDPDAMRAVLEAVSAVPGEAMIQRMAEAWKLFKVNRAGYYAMLRAAGDVPEHTQEPLTDEIADLDAAIAEMEGGKPDYYLGRPEIIGVLKAARDRMAQEPLTDAEIEAQAEAMMYRALPADASARGRVIAAMKWARDRMAPPCCWCDGKQFIYDDQRKTIKIPCPRCQQAQPRCKHGRTETGTHIIAGARSEPFYCPGPVAAPPHTHKFVCECGGEHRNSQCIVSQVSSRVCAYGTFGCDEGHSA
jgi:hypothetical protein